MNDEISDFFTKSIRRRAVINAPTVQDLFSLLTMLEPVAPAEKRVKPLHKIIEEYYGILERDWPAMLGYTRCYLKRNE